jgi:hypothetical protein
LDRLPLRRRDPRAQLGPGLAVLARKRVEMLA